VILGKTNVPELCADFQTDSPLFGTTKNPWDRARGAGGSTGGGAVAVAARLSPLELGSDIGGSVRNPAHYNGIFSLKPTEWRVPGRGHVPDLPGVTRACATWARSAAGALGRRSRTGAAHHRRSRRLRGGGAAVPIGRRPAQGRDLRIAVLESNPLVKVSDDTAKVVQATAKLLSKAGAKVKRAEPRGLDWTQGWEDWCDLFQYLILRCSRSRTRALLRHGRFERSVGPLRSAGVAARHGAVLCRARPA
jgi:amidase